MNLSPILITGASSGIGYSLAEEFAKHEHSSIILVARNEQKLQNAKENLEKEFPNTQFTTMAYDLSKPENCEELFHKCQQQNLIPQILINNAGYGNHGSFMETDKEFELNMIDLNVRSLTHLNKLFIPEMLQQKNKSHILNVASIAGFLPGPYMATYYATKAYVISLSEALAEELRNTNIHVSVLCPGPTETEFSKTANLENKGVFKNKVMSSKEVAEITYKELLQNKTIILPGIKNKLMPFFLRFVPRKIIAKISGSINK